MQKNKEITKPIIAWCIGTSSNFFNNDIQFGHAGASVNNKIESSLYKNFYMKESGILVPNSFEDIKGLIELTMKEINFTPNFQKNYNNVAKDFDDLYKNNLIRKSSTINSSISSDTNKELFYNNKSISNIIADNSGIGSIIGLLWFKKELPKNVTQFFELILSICADHGPAVSGAHNTIITARAGKDLVSSLCSGLLTIGPKFGGAIKDALTDFYEAFNVLTPQEFIKKKKEKGELIMGIGHKVKSSKNPDSRVEILKEYFIQNFKNHEYLNYALEVEKLTLIKKDNLILNVDGCIVACLLDIFTNEFSDEEIKQIINSDIVNGFFVLARTIGFIGHYNDQNRLNQGLWRAESNSINFISESISEKDQ